MCVFKARRCWATYRFAGCWLSCSKCVCIFVCVCNKDSPLQLLLGCMAFGGCWQSCSRCVLGWACVCVVVWLCVCLQGWDACRMGVHVRTASSRSSYKEVVQFDASHSKRAHAYTRSYTHMCTQTTTHTHTHNTHAHTQHTHTGERGPG